MKNALRSITEIWLVFSLSIVIISTQSRSAEGADNPFREEKFLRQSLSKIAFNRTPYFELITRNGEYTSSILSLGNSRIPIESMWGLMLERKVIEIEPVGQDHKPFYRIKIKSPLPDSIVAEGASPHFNPGKKIVDGIRIYLFSRQILGSGNIEYKEWTEGNIEYASATGTYLMVSLLSGKGLGPYKFKLIAERNPASNGWFLSQYRGFGSEIDSEDEGAVYRDIEKYRTLSVKFRDRVASAINRNHEIVREIQFPGYSRHSGITQVPVGSKNVMVHLAFFPAATLEAATHHCEKQLEVGGYSSWRLPKQYELATILTGGHFSKWRMDMPIKDSADRYFFGGLYPRCGVFCSFALVTSSTKRKKNPAYIDTGLNLGKLFPHSTIKKYYTENYYLFVKPQRNTFFGDATGMKIEDDKHRFYVTRSGINAVGYACINDDAKENESFRTASLLRKRPISAEVKDSSRRMSSVPVYIKNKNLRLAIARILDQNPGYGVALESNYAFPKEVEYIKNSYKNDNIFFVSSDINGDGEEDYVISLTSDKSGKKPGKTSGIVVFNGPVEPDARPNFMNLKWAPNFASVLFQYINDRGKAEVLVGKFESRGALLVPNGNGYTLSFD